MNPKIRVASFLLLASLAAGLAAEDAKPAGPVELPGRYDQDRFVVTPMSKTGQPLSLFTDTGGGLFLTEAAVKRLALPKQSVGQDANRIDFIELPAFQAEAAIPPPLGNSGHVFIMPERAGKHGPIDGMDGMLGQAWFSGRVWTFDYPGRRLLWRPAGDVPAVEPTHRVSLGFQADKDGKRQADFPRITATIDGQALDLLFDTGATVSLSPQALEKLADKGPAQRGTSFIAATHFDRWRQKHPDWRVIEDADVGIQKQPMIEVPAVTVAGYTVGPVWFTRREDANFHEFMSQWMDKQVEGALGGSALKYFRVTVDYPKAVAVFEKP
ncbi:MAG: hypothetical protein ACJ75H_17675 [Thermoanaerobaculia bacterium]